MSDPIEQLMREVLALRSEVEHLRTQERDLFKRHPVAPDDVLLYAPFDGPGPWNLNFSGDPTGHLGQAATVSGGVIYRPGRHGKAVQVAEATTNLFDNPTAGVNITNWFTATNGSVATFVRDTTQTPVYGSTCFKLTPGAGSYWQAYENLDGTNTGASFTVSYYVRRSDGAAVGSGNVRVIVNGNSYLPDSVVSIGNSWYRVSKTSSATMNRAQGVDFRVAGIDWYFCACQCEAKAYATPYCDGSLGSGHSWSGTPHASTSSRTAASLSYPAAGNINPLRGTVLGWLTIDHVETGGTQCLFRCSGTTAGHIIMRLDAGRLSSYWGTQLLWPAPVLSPGTYAIALTFDGATQTQYLQGVRFASGAASGFSGLPVSMYVGSSLGTTEFANGLIDDLTILSRPLTADEVRAVYESGSPLHPPQYRPSGVLYRTPATSSDPGNPGDVCWDASYIYVCTAANTWKRVALGAF